MDTDGFLIDHVTVSLHARSRSRETLDWARTIDVAYICVSTIVVRCVRLKTIKRAGELIAFKSGKVL